VGERAKVYFQGPGDDRQTASRGVDRYTNLQVKKGAGSFGTADITLDTPAPLTTAGNDPGGLVARPIVSESGRGALPRRSASLPPRTRRTGWHLAALLRCPRWGDRRADPQLRHRPRRSPPAGRFLLDPRPGSKRRSLGWLGSVRRA